MKNIPFVNLSAQWAEERDELLPIIDKILSSGQYVGGEEVTLFEHNIAERCGVEYCVALNSGTDALITGLRLSGVGIGDEVITPPNSFVASTAAIINIGAKPVFVDVQEDQNIDPSKIEVAITDKTKAIMPVHLTGRVCDMGSITEISERYGIPIVEDAAQAIGAKYKNIPAGSFGKVGCFSGHPLKNLNAFGDAGFLTTNDRGVANAAKLQNNHGLISREVVGSFGGVSRMDNLQAGILNYHLTRLDSLISVRRRNAGIYCEMLDKEYIKFPKTSPEKFDTFHTYVIQVDDRDRLKKYLLDNGVQTSIHYPVPLHLQPAAIYLNHKEGNFPVAEEQSRKILTLPINQYLDIEQVETVCFFINKYFSG